MRICANCARESEGDFAFCPYCASPLAAVAPVREQRKTVTVVFCDVTGSTALGESVDPEALRAVLARYFGRVKAIVESHGGTVEKFIGDAVNVAARLEQAAAPDEVLIGQATLALVRDAVEVERVEPLVLKGKAEPV